jgi:nitroreductase
MQQRTVATSEEALATWAIDAAAFPGNRSEADRLLFLINYAVLAPSSHNAQPWRFRLCNRSLEICADPARALPIADPAGREQIMSCGAAVFNLRIALRHFGFSGDITTLPDANEPDLLARIQLGPHFNPTPAEAQLFEAIPRRHTNRFPFEARLPSIGLLTDLREAAALEGARLKIVEGEAARQMIASLVAAGDRRQYEDLDFRKELATWIHPNRSQRRDGLPGYAFGIGGLLSYVGPLAIRVFNHGEARGQHDRQVVEGSPVLAILTTPADTPADWLAAGQALQRVLLRATADGVSASFLNQPIQVPDLRVRLRNIIGDGPPQMLIRLGYGPPVKPTPRRAVGDVLETYFVDQWY